MLTPIKNGLVKTDKAVFIVIAWVLTSRLRNALQQHPS